MTGHEGQVLIGFKCDAAFRREIERAAGSARMSEFIREAIIEKMRSMNIHVDASLAAAPSRLGKGGPRPMTQRMGLMTQSLNEPAAEYAPKPKPKPRKKKK